jgi:hypothetical protein
LRLHVFGQSEELLCGDEKIVDQNLGMPCPVRPRSNVVKAAPVCSMKALRVAASFSKSERLTIKWFGWRTLMIRFYLTTVGYGLVGLVPS